MGRHAFLLLLMILGPSLLRGEQVQVTGVEGQVLYGPGNAKPAATVRTGQRLGAGTFSAGSNGILYLSSFEGSELRLGESGTLHFDGTNELCPLEKPPGPRSTFRLLAGKLEIDIKHPSAPRHCYHIILQHAQASISTGQCVMCMHGGSTFLFVARGSLLLQGGEAGQRAGEHRLLAGSPPAAPDAVPISSPGQAGLLVGDGRVGVIDETGRLSAQPLSTMNAGTQGCLLAGFNADNAGGRGKKSFSADAAAVVSPTQ